MDKLISRQAAIDAVHNVMFEFFDLCDDDEESPLTEKEKTLFAINKRLTKRIKALPSAQTIEPERKKGRWIMENVVLTSNPPQYKWHCSECGRMVHGFTAEVLTDYCPNCGADMRGDTDG